MVYNIVITPSRL